jgi:hypothetical protein
MGQMREEFFFIFLSWRRMHEDGSTPLGLDRWTAELDSEKFLKPKEFKTGGIGLGTLGSVQLGVPVFL